MQQAHDLNNLTDLSIDPEMLRAADRSNSRAHLVAA
jgi:hypothetical protein